MTEKSFQRVGIVGGGAWGTALAHTLVGAGRNVLLWAYEPDTVQEINDHHTNRVFLPGVALHDGGPRHSLARRGRRLAT